MDAERSGVCVRTGSGRSEEKKKREEEHTAAHTAEDCKSLSSPKNNFTPRYYPAAAIFVGFLHCF
jgi:hypothetical protein